MVDITVKDVENVYGEQAPSLDTAKRKSLTAVAENLTEDVFGGRQTRQDEIEGDESDFTAFLAAHLWEIAEGGEPNSQSMTGGSVNVQHLQTDIESTLSETRFGRICLMMTRNRTNTAIVRSDF